jgi:hypothetical protein
LIWDNNLHNIHKNINKRPSFLIRGVALFWFKPDSVIDTIRKTGYLCLPAGTITAASRSATALSRTGKKRRSSLPIGAVGCFLLIAAHGSISNQQCILNLAAIM